MNEKQSMLLVIGSQAMQIAVLQNQIALLQAENEGLKKAAAPAGAVQAAVVEEVKPV